MQNFLNNNSIQVSDFIVSEIQFLIGSFILGVLITFIYDGLKIVRAVIKHNGIFIAIEDLMFWIFTSISIFYLQYYQNDGIFRIFAIGGTMLGMFIYSRTVSNFYVKQMSWLVKGAVKGIKKIIYLLLLPAKKTCRWSNRKIIKFMSKMRLIRKIIRNRLTAIKKVIKLTLHNSKR